MSKHHLNDPEDTTFLFLNAGEFVGALREAAVVDNDPLTASKSDVETCAPTIGDDEENANLTLMAASKDLYGALEFLIDACDQTDRNGVLTLVPSALITARLALAKARGEKQ